MTMRHGKNPWRGHDAQWRARHGIFPKEKTLHGAPISWRASWRKKMRRSPPKGRVGRGLRPPPSLPSVAAADAAPSRQGPSDGKSMSENVPKKRQRGRAGNKNPRQQVRAGVGSGSLANRSRRCQRRLKSGLGPPARATRRGGPAGVRGGLSAFRHHAPRPVPPPPGRRCEARSEAARSLRSRRTRYSVHQTGQPGLP